MGLYEDLRAEAATHDPKHHECVCPLCAILARHTAPAGGERYGVLNGWLIEYTGKHNCGTEPDGHYGAHEPGCGLEPVAKIEDLLGANSQAHAEHSRILNRVAFRMAVELGDVAPGETETVADVEGLLERLVARHPAHPSLDMREVVALAFEQYAAGRYEAFLVEPQLPVERQPSRGARQYRLNADHLREHAERVRSGAAQVTL